MNQKLSFVLLFLIFLIGNKLKGQGIENLEGLLIYSYNNFYDTKEDSIKEENKLKLLWEAGLDVGNRKHGTNHCYIKVDTLFMALFDEHQLHHKNYNQIGNDAYIENMLTGSTTWLTKAAFENSFDQSLKENWRDSIDVNSILKRDKRKYKKLKKSKTIDGKTYEIYKWKKNKQVSQTYWVDPSILQGDDQHLSTHFETIFFEGKLIFRKEAYHKGRLTVLQLIDKKIGEIKNLKSAIDTSDINKIKLIEKE